MDQNFERIEVHIDRESLGDIPPGAYESALRSRLVELYPDATISTYFCSPSRYLGDGEPSEFLKCIGEKVFDKCCKTTA